ncbi:MAG: Leader peptidase (Prepilin peptidase) / N-methyltransferase [Frankiales bacterium]|nr:Leader peptidase (Prepilin peptidase) / N-methyltransferase [Frankiales bacterium]
MPVLIAATLLLGLAIGSFLNVVIHRVPLGLSLVSPPSRCPSCGSQIHNRHNVPLVGWLWLHGKCADCSAPIGVRYPLVELSCAVLFVVVTLRLHRLDLLPALPAYLYFAAVGLALALIDVEHHRLPNAIVLPSYPVVAVLLTIAALWQHDLSSLLRALIGAAALYGLYFLLWFIHPRGMGFGDVKLAGVIGGLLAFVSWSTLIVGAFAAFLLGGVVSTAVLLSKRGNRKTAIPFGPFMILGALIALFVAAPISQSYLDLVTGG